MKQETREHATSEEFQAWVQERSDAIAHRHFYISLAGVSHTNPDGTERQTLIAECEARQPLELVRDPDNEYDPKAVKVMRRAEDGGGQIGFLDRRCAQEISNKMERGLRFEAAFCDMREAGHRPGAPHIYAAVIVIFELTEEKSREIVAAERLAATLK